MAFKRAENSRLALHFTAQGFTSQDELRSLRHEAGLGVELMDMMLLHVKRVLINASIFLIIVLGVLIA